MRYKIVQTSAALAALSVFVPHTMAHSVPTHVNITKVAVEYLKKYRPSSIPCVAELDAILQEGTKGEDLLPKWRYFNHFSPNLTFGPLPIYSTCSSIDWGLPNSPQCGLVMDVYFYGVRVPVPIPVTWQENDHTHFAAISNSREPPTVGAPSANGWRDLGYVLHLLEDLSSPAHVRDDAHPHHLEFAGELTGADGFLDEYGYLSDQNILMDDPMEVVNGQVANRDPLMPSTDRINELNARTKTAADLFLDLRTFVQNNYYSKSKVFEGVGPEIADQDSQYFYGECIPDVECPSGRRKIAHKGFAYYSARGVVPSFAMIDDVIADEQFAELGPVVVLYAAAFLDQYLYQTGAAVPDSCGSAPTLMSHWDFEDVAGDVLPDGTTVPDVTGNDHDGTAFGGPTLVPSSVAGGSQAMQFSAGKAVEVPGSADLLPGKHDYTLSAWFKTSVTGVPQAIVWPQVGCCGNTSVLQLNPTDEVRWSYHDDRIICCGEPPNQVEVVSPGAVADGEWHHVVIVRDRSAGLARMYIDGLEAATSPDSEANITTSSVFAIGHRSINALGFREPGRFFQGLLDEIKIWNGALSASQIMNLYNAEKP